jgi:hypothetical protein
VYLIETTADIVSVMAACHFEEFSALEVEKGFIDITIRDRQDLDKYKTK